MAGESLPTSNGVSEGPWRRVDNFEVNEATGEVRKAEDATDRGSTYDYDPWLPIGDGTFEVNADTGERRLATGDDDEGAAGVREPRRPINPTDSDAAFADISED